jgi:predicted RNase H-like nuclease
LRVRRWKLAAAPKPWKSDKAQRRDILRNDSLVCTLIGDELASAFLDRAKNDGARKAKVTDSIAAADVRQVCRASRFCRVPANPDSYETLRRLGDL